MQAEVLGPLHAWSVGYSAAQKKVDAMRRHALELDSRRRTVIELSAQVQQMPCNPMQGSGVQGVVSRDPQAPKEPCAARAEAGLAPAHRH